MMKKGCYWSLSTPLKLKFSCLLSMQHKFEHSSKIKIKNYKIIHLQDIPNKFIKIASEPLPIAFT